MPVVMHHYNLRERTSKRQREYNHFPITYRSEAYAQNKIRRVDMQDMDTDCDMALELISTPRTPTLPNELEHAAKTVQEAKATPKIKRAAAVKAAKLIKQQVGTKRLNHASGKSKKKQKITLNPRIVKKPQVPWEHEELNHLAFPTLEANKVEEETRVAVVSDDVAEPEVPEVCASENTETPHLSKDLPAVELLNDPLSCTEVLDFFGFLECKEELDLKVSVNVEYVPASNNNHEQRQDQTKIDPLACDEDLDLSSLVNKNHEAVSQYQDLDLKQVSFRVKFPHSPLPKELTALDDGYGGQAPVSSELTLNMWKNEETFRAIAPDAQLLPSESRRDLIGWMSEVSNELHWNRETFHVAIDLLDRYLVEAKVASVEKVQDYAAVCLVIAGKYFEYEGNTVSGVLHCCDMSLHTFRPIELEILAKLEYNINAPTAYSWLRLFSQLAAEKHPGVLGVSTSWPIHQLPTLHPEVFTDLRLRDDILSSAVTLLDTFAHCPSFQLWPKSVRAAAVFLFSISILTDVDVGYLAEQVFLADTNLVVKCKEALEKEAIPLGKELDIHHEPMPALDPSNDLKEKVQIAIQLDIGGKMQDILEDGRQPAYMLRGYDEDNDS